MTLKRLFILLGILVVLAGAGIMGLWQYAYTSEGRARVIIAQLRGDTSTLRGWMLQHHLVRPGFSIALDPGGLDREISATLGEGKSSRESVAAANEMVNLGREVLPIVLGSLRDGNRDAQMMAIRACGKFHDPAAIQPLVNCLRYASRYHPTSPRYWLGDYDVECLCLDSLIEIGPEAYGPLLKAAKDKDPQCPWDTLALVRGGIPGTLARKWGPAAVPRLIELIADPEWGSKAVEALGVLKDKRATDSLVKRLSADSLSVGMGAAHALGEILDPKSIRALLKTIQDKKVHNLIRIPAAGALARMGREEGLKFLLDMVKSPVWNDRLNAAEELGLSRIKGTLQPLLGLLADRVSDIRRKAIWALGELHDPAAIPALRNLLHDDYHDIRIEASQVLKDLEPKHAPDSQPAKP